MTLYKKKKKSPPFLLPLSLFFSLFSSPFFLKSFLIDINTCEARCTALAVPPRRWKQPQFPEQPEAVIVRLQATRLECGRWATSEGSTPSVESWALDHYKHDEGWNGTIQIRAILSPPPCLRAFELGGGEG